MKKGFLCLCIAILLFSCAGGHYQNKDYTFEKEDTYNVALIPLSIRGVSRDLYAELDTFYAGFFEDTTVGRITIPAYDTRKKLPDSYSERLRDYSISTPSIHTLNDIFTKTELEKIRRVFSETDFIVVPHKFIIDENYNLQATIGFAAFRVYELQGGTLLYEKKKQLSFGGPTQETVKFQCGVFLLGEQKLMFNKYFSKHIL